MMFCPALDSHRIQNPVGNILPKCVPRKYFYKSYDQNAARMTENGNKTHITGPFYCVPCAYILSHFLSVLHSRTLQ